MISLGWTTTVNLKDLASLLSIPIFRVVEVWTGQILGCKQSNSTSVCSTVHCTLYMYKVHCTLHSVHCILYTVHSRTYTPVFCVHFIYRQTDYSLRKQCDLQQFAK